MPETLYMFLTFASTQNIDISVAQNPPSYPFTNYYDCLQIFILRKCKFTILLAPPTGSWKYILLSDYAALNHKDTRII